MREFLFSGVLKFVKLCFSYIWNVIVCYKIGEMVFEIWLKVLFQEWVVQFQCDIDVFVDCFVFFEVWVIFG